MNALPDVVVDMSDDAAKTRFLNRLDALSGKFVFRISLYRAKRSNAQNAFYWGVVLAYVAQGISDCWGESVTVDEAHEFMKAKFLRRPLTNKKTGERRGYTVASTPKCNTTEFGEYLEKIIHFAAMELGVVIPDPMYDGATRAGPHVGAGQRH